MAEVTRKRRTKAELEAAIAAGTFTPRGKRKYNAPPQPVFAATVYNPKTGEIRAYEKLEDVGVKPGAIMDDTHTPEERKPEFTCFDQVRRSTFGERKCGTSCVHRAYCILQAREDRIRNNATLRHIERISTTEPSRTIELPQATFSAVADALATTFKLLAEALKARNL